MLPAGFRQKDQTQKAATGPFDREHLLMYLEKEALEQKDREDFVPFTGEKKGRAHRLSISGHNALRVLWSWPGSRKEAHGLRMVFLEHCGS